MGTLVCVFTCACVLVIVGQSDDEPVSSRGGGTQLQGSASPNGVALRFPDVSDSDFDSLELPDVCDRLEVLVTALVEHLRRILEH